MSRVNRYGKKRKRWRRVIAVIVIIAAVYLGGMAFFHTHYYPKTRVGNINIGLKSKKGAKAYVKDELEQYTLTVLEKDGDETISAKDAGLSFSDIDKVDSILDNQPYHLWFYNIFKPYDYNELNIQVDQDTLRTYVDTLRCMNPEVLQGPVSPSIDI